MKRSITLLILIVFGGLIFGQNPIFVSNIEGLYLGQEKKCVSNKFGQPYQSDNYDDGCQYDTYYLNTEKTAHIRFDFHRNRSEVIHSIEVFGTSYSNDVYGIKLGDYESKVLRILGAPDSRVYDQEDKLRDWVYKNSNVTVRMTLDKRVKGIRITEKEEDFFPEITAARKPNLRKILTDIDGGERSTMAKYISPNLVIKDFGSEVTFRNSLEDEISKDQSRLFEFLSNRRHGLTSILYRDLSITYLRRIKIPEKGNPVIVYKFQPPYMVKEIVFKYIYGEYKIAEITTFDE